MNNIDLTIIYSKIDFVTRFKNLSANHNNFKERLDGNKKELYDNILSKYDYKIKYFKKETFYKIEENIDGILFIVQFVLKDGIVEPMQYVKISNDYGIPAGRFDSICEKLDSSFSRKEYPIPIYCSENELEIILDEIFSIYEDFKQEIIKTFLGRSKSFL